MNKKDAEEISRATEAGVRRLLVYYTNREGWGGMMSCPLCQAAKDRCSLCPWVVLDRASSTKADFPCSSKVPNIVYKRRHPSARWRAASINRLRRWLIRIKDGTYSRLIKGQP